MFSFEQTQSADSSHSLLGSLCKPVHVLRPFPANTLCQLRATLTSMKSTKISSRFMWGPFPLCLVFNCPKDDIGGTTHEGRA